MPHKPAKRAYEQHPEKVQEWLDESYPAIKSRAKQEKAEIYWGDETGLRGDGQHERGYAPRGKTPIVRINACRTSTNMISAITNQGKVRFKVFEGSMNVDVLIDFCRRLIKAAGKKVFLILDNLHLHNAKRFRQWLNKHTDEIEVFYLPSSSSELNPDEDLNGDLKSGVHSGEHIQSKGQFKKKVTSHMEDAAEKTKAARKLLPA